MADWGYLSNMAFRNTLLSHLPQRELAEIAPFLSRVWLPADTRLQAVEQRLDLTYFPESVIVSVIVGGGNGRSCCIGLYGFEGFGCTGAIFGIPTSPADEIVQYAGYAHQIRTTELRARLAELPDLRHRLERYVHIFLMQVSYTAFANGNTRLDQRLARLLLMYQDRALTGSLAITHQRLAEILGARRAGVTEALHLLEGARLIRAHRGLIDIIDRENLASLTAGSYGASEAEYLRLI
jgi:hypothetical protein